MAMLNNQMVGWNPRIILEIDEIDVPHNFQVSAWLFRIFLRFALQLFLEQASGIPFGEYILEAECTRRLPPTSTIGTGWCGFLVDNVMQCHPNIKYPPMGP